MSIHEVKARVRYEAETTVTVYIEADDPSTIDYDDVLDEVYSSGELADAIDCDVREFEIVAADPEGGETK